MRKGNAPRPPPLGCGVKSYLIFHHLASPSRSCCSARLRREKRRGETSDLQSVFWFFLLSPRHQKMNRHHQGWAPKVKPFSHLSSDSVCVCPVGRTHSKGFGRPLHLLSPPSPLPPPQSPPLPPPPPPSVPLRSALQSASHIRLFIPGFPPPRASLSFATVALMACQLCLLACTVL